MLAYFDIIFLLIVAVLLILRLRSVLGTRPESKIDDKSVASSEAERAYLALRREVERKLNFAPVASAEEEGANKLDKVLQSIPNFNREDFSRRGLKVFEMVLSAFATKDLSTLKMLTGNKLFAKFKEIIEQRTKDGIEAETDLIGVETLSIEDAKISAKGIASVVVKFISEQVNLLKNAAGEVVEGDENFVQKITDIWTFEKDINSNSPVWLLVSTKKK